MNTVCILKFDLYALTLQNEIQKMSFTAGKHNRQRQKKCLYNLFRRFRDSSKEPDRQ